MQVHRLHSITILGFAERGLQVLFLLAPSLVFRFQLHVEHAAAFSRSATCLFGMTGASIAASPLYCALPALPFLTSGARTSIAERRRGIGRQTAAVHWLPAALQFIGRENVIKPTHTGLAATRTRHLYLRSAVTPSGGRRAQIGTHRPISM